MTASHRVNIVIPMAGEGSRFVKAGYANAKPFIDVNGKPMIRRVLENLALPGARYILLVRKAHAEVHREDLAALAKDFPIVPVTIERLTEGSAATLLFARQYINDDLPMLVANSDQLVDGGISDMVSQCLSAGWDGSIMTFEDPAKDPKWSFARLNASGLVEEVREKVPISTHATVGIYLFTRGKDFVDAAVEMIISNDRSNGEFYTCPVYNYLVRRGLRIGAFDIRPSAMHGLGTPADLDAYLALERCQ